KIKAAFGLSSLKGLGIEESPLLSGCLSQALYYLEDTQKESISHLKIPQIRRRDGHMFLDIATIKNLELAVNNLDQTERFTLLEAIDCACTPMGKRRLRRWIMEPLIIQEQIEFRLSRADFFYKHPSLLREARKILGCISDLERTGARLVLKKAQPREIVALKHSLTYAMQFFKALESGGYDNERISALPNPEPLITDIETVMLEEPSVMPDEGGLIKPGVDARLDEYLASKRDGKTWLLELQKEEAEKSGINTLKIKYNRVFGYYFEITKSHLSNVPVHFIKKQTLANAERFTTEKLQSYEQIILEAEEKSAALEQEIFISLRERLACAIKIIQQLACEIAFVDVIASYAQNALEKKYCCPQITDENILFIKNGRHPVIESCLQSDFIPNDLEMNPDYAVHIITGPNMSGKSTYLRQNALIVLMAQIGSWVPAEEAKIGIVDRIFTRIGASDNLARGESTFLVEMAEAANILNNATGRSLVIMDEIGRGTSTYDGLSLAWAIIEYIIDNPQLSCKTLFATHYHELTGLEKFRGVKNFNVAVKEWKNSVVFLKKVICGAADRSYGIHVAKLAGMPDEVIRRASIILKDLESFSGKTAGAIECDLGRLDKQCEKDQLFFVDPHTEVVIEKLRSYDINNTTPVEALNFLSALKKDL
ncbi:MAG TPA: DNA mismatch repair protein MutS, partial [Spirochaetia bacterium]|nr:DNA mismatch repair protein MutS [Spirochaetia bacterium]